MILDPIKPRALAVRVIPRVAADLAERLGLGPEQTALGVITSTSDDALFVALDEGTKAAAVDVVYARSFYAGAANASGPLSGEAIGVLAAATPVEIESGLQATLRYLETRAWFYAADDAGTLAFFPHVVPAAGRHLARLAGVAPGSALAYLIAPPIEALLGLDAALKVAAVRLQTFYGPPSETNFGGGLLTGDQTACEAAARAFQDTVLDLARHPIRLGPRAAAPRRLAPAAGLAAPPRYRRHDTGEALDAKPAGLTHLFDDQSLVPKAHPIIRLRGQLDLLQAHLLDAQVTARQEHLPEVARDLGDLLAYSRGLLAAEVRSTPPPDLVMAGFTAEELHRVSHHTQEYLGVGFLLPDADLGPTAVKLNLVRAVCREVELAAVAAMAQDSHVPAAHREQLLHGLNRLSNAIYVLTCKRVAGPTIPAPCVSG
jgi:ethanolamine utilization protein EutL